MFFYVLSIDKKSYKTTIEEVEDEDDTYSFERSVSPMLTTSPIRTSKETFKEDDVLNESDTTTRKPVDTKDHDKGSAS